MAADSNADVRAGWLVLDLIGDLRRVIDNDEEGAKRAAGYLVRFAADVERHAPTRTASAHAALYRAVAAVIEVEL